MDGKAFHRWRWLLSGGGAMLVLLLTALSVYGGDPRAAWHSNAFQVLNLEPFPQTFVARFIGPYGMEAGRITDTLPAGAARFYPAASLPIPDTFTGTLAVAAPGQVALEILHLDPITGGNAILEAVPEGMVGNTAYTPIDHCTVLLVHNLAPTATAMLELLAFSSDGTNVGMRGYNLLPESLLQIVPLPDLGLPPDFAGSAVLLADRAIQVTVLSQCGGLAAFVAPAQGSTHLSALYFPPSLPGLVTPTLTIRNTGTEAATGVLIYASGMTEPLSLPPAGIVAIVPPPAYFIYLPLVGKGYGTDGGTFFSYPAAIHPPSDAAVISMTAPVAAVVQVSDSRFGGRGILAYRALSPEQATPAVALPLLLAGYQDWWTGNRIWVQNLGEQPTSVQIRYVTVPTGTIVWDRLEGLEPGQVQRVSLPNLPDGAELAAAILLGDQPIGALAGALNTDRSTRDHHILYPGTNFTFNCIRIAGADFNWSPATPTVGQPVAFTGFVSPADATPPLSFSWSFGDGTYGAGDYVQHTYEQAGTYVVAMTATNCLDFGQASARYTLTVVPPQQVKVLSSYSVLPPIGPQPLTLPVVLYDFFGAHSHPAVQNQQATPIIATVDFFQDMVPILTLTSTVPAYTSWFLDDAPLPPGFRGEAVIHAEGSFFAIDHQVTPNAAVAYHGLAWPYTTLICPELYYDYNGWNSSVDVYNPNQVTTTVSVVYSDGISRMAVLGPGAHHIFSQIDEGHLPGSFFGGMVTADSPVMVLCSGNRPPSGARLYEAAAGGLTMAHIPYLSKPDPEPALFVMNPGAAPVTVTIAGSSVVTIPPGQTWAENIFPPGYADGTDLESTGEVVVVAHVDQPAGPGDPCSAYTVQAAPDTTVWFPFVPKNWGWQGYIWNATLVVRNASPEPAIVQVTLYDEWGDPHLPQQLGTPSGPIANPFLLSGATSQPILLSPTMGLTDGRYSAVFGSDKPLVGMVLIEGYSYPLGAEGPKGMHLRWSGPRMR